MNIRQINYKNFRWLNITSPAQEEMDFLREKFPFHPLDLEDCLSKSQRPKIDEYEDYVFLVLHFPHIESGHKRIVTEEVDIFVGKDFLVSTHRSEISELDKFFNKCYQNKKLTAEYFKKGIPHLAYTVVDKLVDSCFPILNNVSEEIDLIDQKIFDISARKVVENLSVLRRNLIIFQTMIKPQIKIFADIEAGRIKILNGQLSAYWDNILDHLKRIKDRLEDFQEVTEGLTATNESLLSFRTNEVMKILTIFSVILLPLTLISGIYGMNLETLPFALHSHSFTIVASIMLLITGIMLVFFRLKKWL
jgi:magnesium transporter